MTDMKKTIEQFILYAIKNQLLVEEDIIFTTNQLLDLLKIEEAPSVDLEEPLYMELEEILGNILDFACSKELIEDSITQKDLFDTKLMSLLLQKPSVIIYKFWHLYKEQSPKAATDYYYKLSQDSDYIRRYRVCKDKKWVTDTQYGKLDITINLSKPEKDPKAIGNSLVSYNTFR